ncbi:MAG: hypothetical protein QOC70_2102 [Verrucomicrobiota bacterium]
MSSNSRIGVLGLHTAPIEHNELDQFTEIGKTVPSGEARDVVFADKTEKLRGRLAKAE